MKAKLDEPSSMARVSTSSLFSGKVYDKARPNSCLTDVRGERNFDLYMAYNDIDCDIKQDGPGRFSSDIVIQVRVTGSE